MHCLYDLEYGRAFTGQAPQHFRVELLSKLEKVKLRAQCNDRRPRIGLRRSRIRLYLRAPMSRETQQLYLVPRVETISMQINDE